MKILCSHVCCHIFLKDCSLSNKNLLVLEKSTWFPKFLGSVPALEVTTAVSQFSNSCTVKVNIKIEIHFVCNSSMLPSGGPSPIFRNLVKSIVAIWLFFFLSLQCCPQCWYRGIVSSTPSIRCCLASAIPSSRMSRTCHRTPLSQNPLLRPTLCPSRIHQATATQTHQAVAAAPPSLIHHPVLTRAVRSRCRVRRSRHRMISLLPSHYWRQTIDCSLFWFFFCRDAPSCLHSPRRANDSGLSPANGH